MRKSGSVAQKILLLLSGGVALAFTYSPNRAHRILKAISSEWKSIDRHNLQRSISGLYESKLVDYREGKNGMIRVVLTREGKQIALQYKLDELSIQKPKRWDKKWRIILFDIPENYRSLRDTLRSKLKELGLLEFQKSVFVHPYECRDEIDFIIELYDARRFVRFIEAEWIDNGLHLRKKFHLS